MSDTPRTDGAVFVVFSSPSNDVEAVDADFARELERENAALRVALHDIMTESDEQHIWRMARAALEKELKP